MTEIVLTDVLDNCVAMVVMDMEEYVNKVQELLAQPAYRLLPRGPTKRIKAQLIPKLRTIKRKIIQKKVI